MMFSKPLAASKAQCLISSYSGDFVWLRPCLQSLKKFSEGFLPPVISVEFSDLEAAREIVVQTYPEAEIFVHDVPPPYRTSSAGVGMMRAMSSMMHGDVLCPDADFIFLVGSDCLATGPFRPQDYLHKGRALILMNSYEKLREVHRDAIPWRDGAARVLGFTPPYEYMRRLPSVFHRSTYWQTRKYIERLHGLPFQKYWFDTFAAGQRGQSEANLLGAYAHRFQVDENTFENLDNETTTQRNNVLWQGWSHGGLDRPSDTHFILNGKDTFGRTPREIIADVLK